MKIIEILNKLNEIAPFELQEKWDNSGLIIGDKNREVERIILSLDVDEDVILHTPKRSLIITHHPLIFGKLSTLNFQTYPANLIEKMIKKDIQLISLHTNFDKTILNRYVLENVLGWQVRGNLVDFILIAEVQKSGDEVFNHIKNQLGLKILKFTEKPKFINRVALTTGAGASLKKFLIGKVDLFITGDIKYHEAFEAKSMKLAMLDIGHFESEKFFIDAIFPYVNTWDIEVKKFNSKNPFQYR